MPESGPLILFYMYKETGTLSVTHASLSMEGINYPA